MVGTGGGVGELQGGDGMGGTEGDVDKSKVGQSAVSAGQTGRRAGMLSFGAE